MKKAAVAISSGYQLPEAPAGGSVLLVVSARNRAGTM